MRSARTPVHSATIVLLPGDGVGPEVTAAARLVLEAVGKRFDLSFEFREALIGGAAIDATGTALPRETVELCERSDAVLLGAVGGPAWDNPSASVRPEQGLLGIRRALGVFANLRPVVPHPSLAHISPIRPDVLAGVDMLVVRELTGGIYFGEKSRERIDDGELARDVCSYTTAEIQRIVRVAADLARARKRRLTSVDKANVLETSRLWRRTTSDLVAAEYPDVYLDHMLVDTCAMRLMQRPADFDVIVTDNMFGDILTDEAAVLAGSIGLLPSASLGVASADGARRGLYEPIHGSAPDIAGQGRANPLGAISSAALMLRYSLGLECEARAVEDSVAQSIVDGVVTRDISRDCASAGTMAVAAHVADLVGDVETAAGESGAAAQTRGISFPR
jgi:3-isopropylmalate dehydrogenase